MARTQPRPSHGIIWLIAALLLATAAREGLHAPNVAHPLIDDPFLAAGLTASAGQETSLYGEYDEEQLFFVTYRSQWRHVTGAPPGPRGWFVYAGRNAGEPWTFPSQGTGP